MPAIRADPSQVEQVITNLVFNPCDAMPAGGRLTVDTGVSDDTRARAETRAAKPGRYATLTVADTGEGMDADTLRQIFDPFFTTRDPGRARAWVSPWSTRWLRLLPRGVPRAPASAFSRSMFSGTGRIYRRVADLVDPSIKTLRQILTGKMADASPAVKLQAAKDVLE